MSDGQRISIAAVVPRFGASIGGGAETLVRQLLLNLVDSSRVEQVEVWTTCAMDHRSWSNELPEGVSDDSGILIRRFPVDERDLDLFVKTELGMREGRPISYREQIDWLSNSVNSRKLYAHIAQASPKFDAILFAPYLFATSFWGALIDRSKSILIPCLHDEPYAYLEVFHYLFAEVAGILCNAPAEMRLAESIYSSKLIRPKAAVVGMGFEALPSSQQFSARSVKPFILYSGRKETGKNLDKLLVYFAEFKRKHPDSELELKLIGSGSIDFVDVLPSGVVDLGFVSEEEKEKLMAEAVVLCQPSVNESFSIVLMEAWLRKTPVLVHADCAVTREHVVRSGGGLYFSNKDEFIGVLEELLENGGLQERMGIAGRDYVAEEYSWPAVCSRFFAALESFNICKDLPHSERLSDSRT
jgi:glycosyltransferase involved in cell wall biosynthesis